LHAAVLGALFANHIVVQGTPRNIKVSYLLF
jgi:hypothetical protein